MIFSFLVDFYNTLSDHCTLLSWAYLQHNHHHHHHHVVRPARISLILSLHVSLSFIASGRSSGLHPVSSHSCCMYVRAGRPWFDWPYAGVHRSTSLTRASLLLQQCPACLVRLAWIVFVIGGRWPYSWCLVGCCCQDCSIFLSTFLYNCRLASSPAVYNAKSIKHRMRNELTNNVPLILLVNDYRAGRVYSVFFFYKLSLLVAQEVQCSQWKSTYSDLLISHTNSYITCGVLSNLLILSLLRHKARSGRHPVRTKFIYDDVLIILLFHSNHFTLTSPVVFLVIYKSYLCCGTKQGVGDTQWEPNSLMMMF